MQNCTDIGTRSLCMVQCVRYSDCWAFNHHPDSATCILLPAAGCMTLDGQHGYLFVHLSDCNMVPVREIRRPPDGGWRWVKRESPGNHNDLIKLPGMVTRYVSRVYYDGIYLPGWYQPTAKNPFKSVSPEDKLNKKCLPYSGESLAFNDTSDYRWGAFTAGDPVPDSAAAITALHDGTPFYVIRKSFPGAPGYDLSGYYDPTSKKNYIVNGGVVTPASVKMLLLNWQCGICGTFY